MPLANLLVSALIHHGGAKLIAAIKSLDSTHSVKSSQSIAALKILKAEELKREEARKPITLEVTEEAPTSTQLQNIIDIVGESKIGDLVPGAIGKGDAIKIVDKDPSLVNRPIVVDWGNARVVLDGNESKIKDLLKSL